MRLLRAGGVRAGRAAAARGPQPATAVDVAAEAGCSTATVSLVVNGKADGRVSEPLKQRVLAAIARLDYRVDAVGRTLATGAASTIAFVAPDSNHPFFAEVTAGVGAALGARFQLIVVSSRAGAPALRTSLDRVLTLRPAGLLIDAPTLRRGGELGCGCPVVLLDAPGTRGAEPSVNADLASGAARLAEHLAGLGHRRIAYLDGRAGIATYRVRRDALVRTVRALGADIVEPYARVRAIDIDDAAEAFRRAWPAWRSAGATALVCATDMYAFGVLKAARRLAIDIPHDLAVAGFDDLPYSAIVDPPLTSVAIPAFDLGFEAATQLERLISGAAATTEVVLATRLVIRESTDLVRSGSGA